MIAQKRGRTTWSVPVFSNLIADSVCLFMAQSTTPDQPETPKRVSIGLGKSQLEDLPVPTLGADPLGAVQSAPTADYKVPSNQLEPRNGGFIFAPIPLSSQAIGIGVAPVAAYVFFPSNSDRVSPPSTVAVAGVYTSTKTYGGGLAGNFNLKEDRYRLTFLIGAARSRYEFFGIGTAAGGTGQSIWLSQHGRALFARGLRRLKWNIFAGPRFSHRQIKAGQDTTQDYVPNLPPLTPIMDQLNLAITSAAFGFRIQRDTRDDLFYPHHGLDGRADFFAPFIGSTFAFQSYQFEANKYLPFGKRNVRALRGMGCGVTGEHIPFASSAGWAICGATRPAGIAIGSCPQRRGNGVSFSGSASARRCLAASGTLPPDWGSYQMKELLPAGGAGLRLNLSKQRRINLRLDAAYSKTAGSCSMGMGKVF